ncbi:N-acyl-D-amino-acid deacylase family protein [Brevibacillus invocatus]|uniref:N-acyl-D-amino-acid deacylase family protein n=1 Tax=Brevibacillus invocatus TaxID=173959 RepID=UPI00204071EC|nr:D-aminoacylase [Brevibacillus invocatus]MCM3080633.1 D-aminoacylase [Brevibacillus invocatus]MCM3432522.1 D-aminoacylase [Brevibacillus invocatus]
MKILLRNCRIYDGTGNTWFAGDIAIDHDRIAGVGNVTGFRADEDINVQGNAVAPGFIDIHTHSDNAAFVPHLSKGKIMQGVTTEVIGNCGMSAYPINPEKIHYLKQYVSSLFGSLEWNWTSLSEFADFSTSLGMVTNLIPLIGHGAVRIAAMGFDNRPPTADEMVHMKQLVQDMMDQGAFGLSSGLIYPPGVYCSTEELVELCKVVQKNKGIYATHMRNESNLVYESVEEAIAIGRDSNIPVQISHHKAAGRINWGKPRKTLPLIREARSSGIDVDLDLYPYTAGSTLLSATLPPWCHEGGTQEMLRRLKDPDMRNRISVDIKNGIPGWENLSQNAGWDQVFIASVQQNRELEGKSIDEIAKMRGQDPTSTLLDILIEENGVATMIVFLMSEDDVRYIMHQPETMIGSDGIPDPGKTHPRFFGTFARVLGHYTREEKVLHLEDAIRKMTSFPAKKLGLKDRGIIREGAYADLVVFDPKVVQDIATYDSPSETAAGFSYVFVNGYPVVYNGTFEFVKKGRFIKKGDIQ